MNAEEDTRGDVSDYCLRRVRYGSCSKCSSRYVLERQINVNKPWGIGRLVWVLLVHNRRVDHESALSKMQRLLARATDINMYTFFSHLLLMIHSYGQDALDGPVFGRSLSPMNHLRSPTFVYVSEAVDTWLSALNGGEEMRTSSVVSSGGTIHAIEGRSVSHEDINARKVRNWVLDY